MASNRGKPLRFWPDLTIPEHREIDDYFETLPQDGRGTRKGRELEVALLRHVREQNARETPPPPPPRSPEPEPVTGRASERAGVEAERRSAGAESTADEPRSSANALAQSVAGSIDD
jgi:hypothetical protein